MTPTTHVIVPPTLNKLLNLDSNLRLGQRVSMLCSLSEGDLPMTFKWFRDNQRLMPGLWDGIVVEELSNYDSVLRIDYLKPEHNANFTCVAENDAGQAVHSQMLRVKGTPFPSLSLTHSRTTLASFAWHQPHQKQQHFLVLVYVYYCHALAPLACLQSHLFWRFHASTRT